MTVTSIGDGADSVFANTGVTSVTIPGCVTSIGGAAFENCASLTSVTIPGSVARIGAAAFAGCTSLTSVYFGGFSGAAIIGSAAFSEDPVTLYYLSGTNGGFDYSINAGNTNTVTIIAYTGPAGTVAIPTNLNGLMVTIIGNGQLPVFAAATLTNVTIPASVTTIAESAFEDCTNLTNVTIPGSVTTIGDYAFADCTGLTNVTISDGVTSIGYGVFESCTSLPGVMIPASVTNIGEGPFAYCINMTDIMVDPENLFYSSTNGVLFDYSLATLIQYPGGMGGNYTIPLTVTSIGDDAFSQSGLTSVTIPSGVTSIGTYAIAFCGLTNVTIPGSVTNIGTNAFYYCANLTNATIANGVTSIEEGAFDDTGLTGVTIPGTVTAIGDGALYYCANLTNVLLTGNAPTVGFEAFFGDPVTFYYLPGASGWSPSPGLPNPVLWNPLILAGNASFGVQNNQFGFNITNGTTTNIPIVVEACANLASPVWTPLQTLTLTNSFYFSDPQWTNYPGRYYRISSP